MRLKLNFDFTWGIVLSVIFTILKLTKAISWSWFWVLCPLWGEIILFGVIVAIAIHKGWF